MTKSLLEQVRQHYDLLIDQNNDPVCDPKPLRDYMDQWDGPTFFDNLLLSREKSVLEIGVGTGRLAVKTAPLCGAFYGIDLSPKTIKRAQEHLAGCENVTLICGDFLSYPFYRPFDVIYSSLTFMHIAKKQQAINKVAAMLNAGGRFVLSIDENQEPYLDTGVNKLKVYPDTPKATAKTICNAGLTIVDQYSTAFATIFVAQKESAR